MDASYSGGGNITLKGGLEENDSFMTRLFQGELPLGDQPIHISFSVSYLILWSRLADITILPLFFKLVNVIMLKNYHFVCSKLWEQVMTNNSSGLKYSWFQLQLSNPQLSTCHFYTYRKMVNPRDLSAFWKYIWQKQLLLIWLIIYASYLHLIVYKLWLDISWGGDSCMLSDLKIQCGVSLGLPSLDLIHLPP